MLSLLLAAALSGAVYNGPVYDSTTGNAIPSSGGTLGGNLRLTLSAWFYSTARTTDAAPYVIYIQGSNAAPTATGANQAGGSVWISGGVGTRSVTVANVGADSDGDTWTPTINGTAGQTLTAKNGGAGANQFNCQTSTSVCAVAFAAAVNAQAYGITAACSDATCTSPTIYLTPTTPSVATLTHAIVNNAGLAFATATSGADGQVLLPKGTASAPGISTMGDTDTGIVWTTNGMQFIAGGSVKGIVNSGGIATNASTLTTAALVANSLEADLAAGACTAGTFKVDSGGANREFCRCNDAGTAYDCVTVTTTNGPTN